MFKKLPFRLQFALIYCMICLVSCGTQEPAEIVYGTPVNNDFDANVKIKTVESVDYADNKNKIDDLNAQKNENVENNISNNQNQHVQIDDKNINNIDDKKQQIKIIEPQKNQNNEKLVVLDDPDIKQELLINDSSKKDLKSQSEESLNKLKNIKKDQPRMVNNPSKEEAIKIDELQITDKKETSVIDQDIYSVKLKKPLDGGKIIINYDQTRNGVRNTGVNFSARAGASVYAAESGEVIYVGVDKNYGNLIIVRHDTGDLSTAYAHLDNVNVIKNQYVGRGEVIGRVGKTGNVSQPELFFSVRKGKIIQNPAKYF